MRSSASETVSVSKSPSALLPTAVRKDPAPEIDPNEGALLAEDVACMHPRSEADSTVATRVRALVFELRRSDIQPCGFVVLVAGCKDNERAKRRKTARQSSWYARCF